MQAFLHWLRMGGQGLYVWGSIGVVLGTMAWELLALRRRARLAAAALDQAGERRP